LEVKNLIFVSLSKFRIIPTKDSVGEATALIEEYKKRGIKVLNWYWTLGRYDVVFIFEAASEKDAMKTAMGISKWVTTETLVAIPRQEAVNML
jgi:uncharacterized protein with GYD domain